MITTIEHPRKNLLHIAIEWINENEDYVTEAKRLIQQHLPDTGITDPRVQYAKFLRYVEVADKTYALNSCLSVIVDQKIY